MVLDVPWLSGGGWFFVVLGALVVILIVRAVLRFFI